MSAISSFGRPGAAARRSRRAPATAPASLPSQRPVAHPNAAILASRSPRSETSATQVSDWILLWSTITVISARSRLTAPVNDSQNWPSWSSPSPVSTHTSPRRPASRSARTNPLALEIPMPSEPVFVWTCGVLSTSGCPGQPVEPAQAVQQVELEAPEPDQHCVQRRRVMPLGREVAVALAEHLEVEPRQHVDAREARSDVARAGVRDHVQRVDPAGVGERGRARDSIHVEPADPLELGSRDVAEGAQRTPSGVSGSRSTAGRRAARCSSMRSARAQSFS